MSFSDSNQRRQANAIVGEARTRGILGKFFEILQSSIDFDGADHIIAVPSNDAEERRRRNHSITVNGIVQSKYFENRNAVLIDIKYAIEQDRPREEFFVIIHTDYGGKQIRYFLSAQDVLNLPTDPSGNKRRFSITKNDSKKRFSEFTDQDIAEQIYTGMETTEQNAVKTYNDKLQKRLLVHFELSAGYQARERHIEYYLTNVKLYKNNKGNTPLQAKVVFCHADGDAEVRAIDARWDLWPASQTWAWGYGGTGPHLLAASILGHYLQRKPPTEQMIRALVYGLIAGLSPNDNHTITGQQIEGVIAPYISTERV